MYTKTIDQFTTMVARIEDDPDYPGRPDAFALGIVRYNGDTVLDVRFPTVNHKENYGSAAVFWDSPKELEGSISRKTLPILMGKFDAFTNDGKVHTNIDAIGTLASTYRMSSYPAVWLAIELVWIQDLQKPITSTQDAWLRLHLLSHRKVMPNSINLDGIFGYLQNLAFTSRGPVLASRLDETRWECATEGDELTVLYVDKLPHMLDYVLPTGIRIADGSRVRLGAYLSEGTTVMQEGFVNFNAGTLGESMVEGRISQGVVVGNGSDIGGGASIMGTLSGGGSHKVSIGERSLLGANSGVGISIGDDTKVEAGLYITAGTKVLVPEDLGIAHVERQFPEGDEPWAYARELSGISGVIFRRNSLTGAVEVVPNSTGTPSLNPYLHTN